MAEEENNSILNVLKAMRQLTEDMRNEQKSDNASEARKGGFELERRIDSLSTVLESLQSDIEYVKENIGELQKEKESLDLAAIEREAALKRDGDHHTGTAEPLAPTTKGICYNLIDCRNPFEEDITLGECFQQGGKSWSEPDGSNCTNIGRFALTNVDQPVSVTSAPKHFRSVTRKDCTYSLIQRRSVPKIYLNTSGLRTKVHSDEIVSETTQRTELTNILSGEMSHEISDLQEITQTMTGPNKNIDVNTQFEIWEMYAPRSDRPSGKSWATDEALRKHHRLLSQGTWRPELPLPDGFPTPQVG